MIKSLRNIVDTAEMFPIYYLQITEAKKFSKVKFLLDGTVNNITHG